MPDHLTKPLGLGPQRSRRPVPFFRIAAILSGALVAVVVAWVALVDDPSGGDPVVVVPIERTASAIASGETGPAADAALAESTAEAGKPADSGVRVERIGISKVIEIPDDADEADGGTGPSDDFGAGPVEVRAALLETTEHGDIPRIADDGTRPMIAYARQADALAVGTVRIAVIVGGLGISASGTAEALDRLPGAITLAFAPYGAELEGDIARARRDGHEVLLQLPLEPFDYPNNDPGPRTLLTTIGEDDNLDRLYWLLSRIAGYVGVINYMGARFTADAAALAPVMEEIGDRGLLWVDDGSSSRSQARAVANGKVPFVGADIIVDTLAEPDAIDDRLTQLETLARERGFAVGMASAFPVSIDRIAEWARSAAGRGVVLVPVTALADAGRS